MKRLLVAVGSALALAAAAPPIAAQPGDPEVIDIGTLGGPYAFARAINNKAQVVGQSIDAAETRIEAFVWEHGVMRPLSTPDLWFEIANDINDHGQIVGSGRDLQGRFVALRWDDGVLTALPPPAGATVCSAEAINDHGDVLGWCDQQPASQWGLIWRRTGERVPLEGIPAGWTVGPVEITDKGAILGGGTDDANARVAFIWDDGVLTRINDAPGDPMFLPTALNERGHAAGWGADPLNRRAVLFDGNRVVTLPLPPGTTSSTADGLNERDEVIGAVATGNGFAAAVWAQGRVRVLPSLPNTTTSFGWDINDRGVGLGTYATMPGETRSLIWPKAGTRVPPHLPRE